MCFFSQKEGFFNKISVAKTEISEFFVEILVVTKTVSISKSLGNVMYEMYREK